MKYKIIPTLALLAACGGEIGETPAVSPEGYDLPAEIFKRTLKRSQHQGISAVEHHHNGNHAYNVVAIEGIGSLAFFIENTPQSDQQYRLLDLVSTPGLDLPKGDRRMDILYLLLLAEQKGSLDGEKINTEFVDYWLSVIKKD